MKTDELLNLMCKLADSLHSHHKYAGMPTEYCDYPQCRRSMALIARVRLKADRKKRLTPRGHRK